jgi:8-oxo-dGTP pyrophosphatase MutT (NUDIX family)
MFMSFMCTFSVLNTVCYTLCMQLFVGTKALIHYKGKILILRESSEYLDGSEEGKWDVPGGRISPEETLEQGLQREVKEESGLAVSPGVLLGAYDGFPIIRGEECHVVRLYFLCESASDAVTLSADHDAYAWIDPSDSEQRMYMDDIEEMISKARGLI